MPNPGMLAGMATLLRTGARPLDVPVGRPDGAGHVAALMLFAGLAPRLALARFGGYHGDITAFQGWAHRLATRPPWEFYAGRHLMLDHLPGDLWLVLAVAKIHAVAPQVSFTYSLKVVAALADTGIGLVLFLVGRRLAGPAAGLSAAALYVFNPAIMFETSIWGQWDAVSALVALIGLSIMLLGNPAWGLPVLTLASLSKPHFAALLPLVVLASLIRWLRSREGAVPMEPLGMMLRRLALALLLSLGVVLAVCLPFGVGIPPLPTPWSLLDRVRYAWNYRTYTTTSAFNLWGTPIGGHLLRDGHRFLLGLTYQAWGAIFAGLAVAIILAVYLWRADAITLIWAAGAIMLATFMLTTRVHERYLLPALVFIALLGGLRARYRWMYAALSLTFFLNLYYIYGLTNSAPLPPQPYGSAGYVWVVCSVNVAILLGMLAFPPDSPRPRRGRELGREEMWPGPVTR